MDFDNHWKTQNIHDDVALSTIDLLRTIEAMHPTAIGDPRRLAVHDSSTGLGIATRLHSNSGVQLVVGALPIP